MTSRTNKRGDAAIAAAITGAFGADVGGDAFIVSGQNKQTQVQEWTQWKQWALDHKDFPAYKEVAIEKIRKHNENVALQLEKEEVQKEIDNLLKFSQERGKESAFLGGLIVLALLIPTGIQYAQRNYFRDWPALLDKAEKSLDRCEKNANNCWPPDDCSEIEKRVREIKRKIR